MELDEIRSKLQELALATPVIDAHTHVQDDLSGFTAEGADNRLNEALALVGSNSENERRAAGRFLLQQLHGSRYSEYAEWLRYMFRLYQGVPRDIDPLDPKHFDVVCDA